MAAIDAVGLFECKADGHKLLLRIVAEQPGVVFEYVIKERMSKKDFRYTVKLHMLVITLRLERLMFHRGAFSAILERMFQPSTVRVS